MNDNPPARPVPISPPTAPESVDGSPNAALDALDVAIAEALRDALAPSTWRAYTADWRHWSAWAHQHHIAVCPASPLDLARYLVGHADQLTIGTLTRRLSAIGKAHLLSGHADPTDDPAVREVLRGLRRQHGTAKQGAPPLWTSDIERIITTTLAVPSPAGPGQGLAEIRDRALLLLAFSTALRRSELAALDIEDLEPDPAGLVVHIRRSKTDQDGQGDYVGVPYASRPSLCPVRAVDAWLDALTHQLLLSDGQQPSGALFRPVDRHDRLGSLGATRHGPDARLSPDAVRNGLIRRAVDAGLTPAHGTRFFTAHSTRSGFATQAAANGATEASIMAQGRWKSLQVARSYIRRGSVFTDNAAGRLGL